SSRRRHTRCYRDWSSDVCSSDLIFRHLKNDLGFHEVGFAPVTTSPNRLYAINDRGMDQVLEQFHILADEYLEYALRGEMHGFSRSEERRVGKEWRFGWWWVQ